MQRYEEDPLTGGMAPNDAIGEWVRYEDAADRDRLAAEVKRLQAEVAALRDTLEMYVGVDVINDALNRTVATATAYRARVEAEALERAAEMVEHPGSLWEGDVSEHFLRWCGDALRAEAARLRGEGGAEGGGVMATEPIRVWAYHSAPEALQISTNGGDEDWLAEVPPEKDYKWVEWLDYGTFGVCCIDELPHPTKEGWRIFIGSHA